MKYFATSSLALKFCDYIPTLNRAKLFMLIFRQSGSCFKVWSQLFYSEQEAYKVPTQVAKLYSLQGGIF